MQSSGLRILEVQVLPVIGNNSWTMTSIQVTDRDGKTSTVPLGASSPIGALEQHSGIWRVHCKEVLADSIFEFVLMVDKPHRTPMIEGFIVTGGYSFGVKNTKFSDITEFDNLGEPYVPTKKEVERVLKYKPLFQDLGG